MTALRPAIVWLRNDLRLHDHEPLHRAIATGAPVCLVYCVDPRQFATLEIGAPKTGAFRARFLLEALADLRHSVRALGGDLVVRVGEPEQVLPAIAREVNAGELYYQADVASEEQRVERAVVRALDALQVKTRDFWGHTLVHRDDLPFSIHGLPDVFTQYRKRVESALKVRAALPAPSTLRCVSIEAGDMPTLASLGLNEPARDPRTTMEFRGGEQAALARLAEWMWEADRLRTYKTTRNFMLHADDSSKLSPWLALGCLSPRRVYEEVLRYERVRVRNDDTAWLIFELHWRDYFRFIAAKWGDRLFHAGGLNELRFPWRGLTSQKARDEFTAWQHGITGFPLVDAAMRELAATGFTSNRTRQNVASFLTRVLGLDWRLGASWFESCLIDYDVASNWANWAYVAGVGNDARGFRFFNVHKQAVDYDPNGEYARHWMPELAALRGARAYRPDTLTPDEQARFGVVLGTDYPRPIVDMFRSAEHNAEKYKVAVAKLPAPRFS